MLWFTITASMLIQCPNCYTTYRVADNLITGLSPTFRCSRCKHTFGTSTQLREVPPKTTAPSPTAGQHEEEEGDLTFSFTSRDDKETSQDHQEPAAPAPLPEEQTTTTSGQREGSWSMSSSQLEEEEPFFISETDPTPAMPTESTSESPSRFEKQREDPPPSSLESGGENILKLDPYRDRQLSALPYLTLFGILVVAYSLLTIMQQSQPQAAERLIRRIPWVGSLIFANNRLKQKIILQSFRPGLQTILGNREVFMVSGVALNQNSVSVRDVQVRGQIYGADGKELEQQTIWIGNAISPKIIRGVTAQDISDLQRLKPLRTFQIPPGESVAFTIVFLRSAKGISEFSCEVLSAEDGS